MDMESFNKRMKQLIGAARNIVWDFDGTLADLHIDWFALKKEVCERLFPTEKFSDPLSLGQIEEKVRALRLRTKYIHILRTYESGATYTLLAQSIHFIKSYGKEYRMAIVSDNLKSTILSILEREQLDTFFVETVAKDDIMYSKPHPEGLINLQKKWSDSKDHWVFIGNSWKDKEAALSFGVRFIDITTV